MSELLVIIPCLNEEQHLEKLVRDVLASNADLTLRIVVVDGGSTDQTPQIAARLHTENPDVVLLDNPEKRQSAGVNLAVATYGNNADYFIRLDAHAGYPADYCRTLIAEAEATQAASIVVSMHTSGITPFQKAVAAAQNSLLGNGGAAHRNAGNNGMWVDHGHHALMRISAFRAVGGYDAAFSHNEDAELDVRLTKAGHKIWLTGKTSLTYYPRATPLALFRQYMNYGEGRAHNILKHGTRPKLRQIAPAFVAPAILLALATPALPIAIWPVTIWVSFCLGYGIRLGVAARDISIVAAGLAAMLMHLGWSIGFWKGIWVIPRSGADE